MQHRCRIGKVTYKDPSIVPIKDSYEGKTELQKAMIEDSVGIAQHPQLAGYVVVGWLEDHNTFEIGWMCGNVPAPVLPEYVAGAIRLKMSGGNE